MLERPSTWLRMLAGFVTTAAFVGLAALGWGSFAGLLAHPARLGVCVVSFALAVVSSFSAVNLSPGLREDAGNRWIFPPFLVLAVLWGWLPAFSDRRDLLTLDGDVVRWVGLVLFVAGGTLRVWPMFVLGRRFSGLVAIQEGHELVTDGLYRVIRHPSYLGGIVSMVGWVLVFRSTLGLLLVAASAWLVVARIDAEEALLASQFGERYAAFRARTWRLVPFIY
jgi:protein-S-isoprenylcysteine O-methyltransferase Ste14